MLIQVGHVAASQNNCLARTRGQAGHLLGKGAGCHIWQPWVTHDEKTEVTHKLPSDLLIRTMTQSPLPP